MYLLIFFITGTSYYYVNYVNFYIHNLFMVDLIVFFLYNLLDSLTQFQKQIIYS